MEQSLYWTELFHLKVGHRYTECYLAHAEKWERWINMTSALCASSSIGAWVIWKDAAFLWALIIAASQVLQAVKPFLPFQERIKRLAGLRNSYAELFVYADSRWPSIAAGELTIKELAKLRNEIRTRQLQYDQKAFPTSALPENVAFLEEATQYAEKYFLIFYGAPYGNTTTASATTAST